ncbi:MAG: PRC-barrel domain-containing protein [bacterium]
MKLHSLLLVAIFTASSSMQMQGAAKEHPLEYRAQESFTELHGVDVRNLQNQMLGTIQYLTTDLENARLVEVIVTSGGGFLGIGRRTTAVPPRALIFDNENHTIRLDVSKERFDASPKFDRSHMMPASQSTRVAEINRYYGLQPWFYEDGQKVIKNTQILRLGHIERADRLLGFTIVNTKGEYIGKVGSLIYDLSKGQIVHIVAVNDGNATPSSIIQPRALRFNRTYSGLVLDDSMAELSGEPHFKWIGGGSTAFQQESYVNREIEADHGVHSRQNRRSGLINSAILMKQGKSFRDEQKTARINEAIQADPTLSTTAKEIEVVTLNAQTTLRGHVNSVEGKQRIGEIAAKSGRAENVSNLLEVRPPLTETVDLGSHLRKW